MIYNCDVQNSSAADPFAMIPYILLSGSNGYWPFFIMGHASISILLCDEFEFSLLQPMNTAEVMFLLC